MPGGSWKHLMELGLYYPGTEGFWGPMWLWQAVKDRVEVYTWGPQRRARKWPQSSRWEKIKAWMRGPSRAPFSVCPAGFNHPFECGYGITRNSSSSQSLELGLCIHWPWLLSSSPYPSFPIYPSRKRIKDGQSSKADDWRAGNNAGRGPGWPASGGAGCWGRRTDVNPRVRFSCVLIKPICTWTSSSAPA